MHKANEVLDAFVSAVDSLSTTGSNVKRTRGYLFDETPGITVRAANVDPINQISNAFLDSAFEVETLYHVSGTDEDLDSQLLQIDAEVYFAVMADRTLGGSAITVDPGFLSIESNAEAERPTAFGIRKWRCHIRHSITDAES